MGAAVRPSQLTCRRAPVFPEKRGGATEFRRGGETGRTPNAYSKCTLFSLCSKVSGFATHMLTRSRYGSNLSFRRNTRSHFFSCGATAHYRPRLCAFSAPIGKSQGAARACATARTVARFSGDRPRSPVTSALRRARDEVAKLGTRSEEPLGLYEPVRSTRRGRTAPGSAAVSFVRRALISPPSPSPPARPGTGGRRRPAHCPCRRARRTHARRRRRTGPRTCGRRSRSACTRTTVRKPCRRS